MRAAADSPGGSAVSDADERTPLSLGAVEHPPSSRGAKHGALAFMITEGLLFGLPLGSIAFRNVLVANGAFSVWCKGGETECHAQEVAIAQFTQLIVVLSSPGSVLVEPLTQLLGINGAARALIFLYTCGFCICGIALRAGWSYVLGMTVVAVSGSAMMNLNFGAFFGAATAGAPPDVVSFWMTNLAVCVDIGFVLAVAAAGIMTWGVVPFAWWFVVFGVAVGAGLLFWFERSVRLDRGNRRADAILDRPPPRSFMSLLRDRTFLVATMQFTWSLLMFNSIEAASARIARYFGLQPTASFYAPVAVSVGSMGLLLWAHSPLSNIPRVSGSFRIALSGTVACLFGVFAFRCPVTYYVGFGVGGAWRSASIAAAINQVYAAGAGGSESRAYAFMTVIAMALCVCFGQLITYATGSSEDALSTVMLMAPLGAFAWEVLSPSPLVEGDCNADGGI